MDESPSLLFYFFSLAAFFYLNYLHLPSCFIFCKLVFPEYYFLTVLMVGSLVIKI